MDDRNIHRIFYWAPKRAKHDGCEFITKRMILKKDRESRDKLFIENQTKKTRKARERKKERKK